MRICQPSEKAIREAVEALRDARLVAFPTETVYGLGADASNPQAISRLYQAKGRPTAHPVIVHLYSAEQIDEWANNIPEPARLLAQKLWPGPLTLILPGAEHVLAQVTGGQSSVGLRVPSHTTAQALLRAFGGGLAAPSANKFGRLSPTTANDVADNFEFEQEVDMVLDGGISEVGIESTIVDFSSGNARILRPGMILPEQIESIIGNLDRNWDRDHTAHGSGAGAPRAPGLLKSHYAPHTPTRLVEGTMLAQRLRTLNDNGQKVALLSFQEGLQSCVVRGIVASPDPARYAHDLYSNLRKLDGCKADVILVEVVPETDAWSAVADRLKRASTEQ
jgi:L-threonylcarbamoyladenylate synthase